MNPRRRHGRGLQAGSAPGNPVHRMPDPRAEAEASHHEGDRIYVRDPQGGSRPFRKVPDAPLPHAPGRQGDGSGRGLAVTRAVTTCFATHPAGTPRPGEAAIWQWRIMALARVAAPQTPPRPPDRRPWTRDGRRRERPRQLRRASHPGGGEAGSTAPAAPRYGGPIAPEHRGGGVSSLGSERACGDSYRCVSTCQDPAGLAGAVPPMSELGRRPLAQVSGFKGPGAV